MVQLNGLIHTVLLLFTHSPMGFWNSTGRGRMRSIYNQRATRTISMHTLRHLLRETEHVWDCLECSEVDSANQ